MKESVYNLLQTGKKISFRPILLLFFSFFLLSSFAQDGEALFKKNCASCHTVTDKKMVGPGLQGITEKRSAEWLIKWTRNSSDLIASGDTDAIAVFDEYNKIPMPPFALSDEEINALYTYVANPSGGVAAPTAPAATAESKPAASTTVSSGGGLSTTSIVIIIVVALMLLLALIVKVNAEKIIQHEAGNAPSPGGLLANNKKIFAALAVVLVLFGLKGMWDAMMGVSVTVGYQPEQPIAFSHKVHVGQNNISCNYCHTGARKGKVSGIPPASTCMNCHKYVTEGTTTGTTEIAKIYKALDYNPETQTYGNNPSPIEWVRVHNLPDHAYFNHAQHVTAGKIECQTCHGPVEEMHEARQHSPLTMGWCVDCHRKTEVKTENNAYYAKLHDRFKEKYKGQPLTVEKLGGLDCARCHY